MLQRSGLPVNPTAAHQMFTSHCCPCFDVGGVLGIEKILGNMAHMSNMFSHRVATKGWSIWYIKWENMGRKGNMAFFITML